jgi:uncharacterized lipoprotein YajG
MMNFQSPIMKALLLSCMVFLLLGWRGDKTIQITPVQPVVPESPLSTTSSAKIKVYNFFDARQGMLDPYLIGKRTAAFKVPLGDVYSERPVVEIVTEAVKSEFTHKGYKLVQENEDFSVKGKIVQFWANTPVKMMGAAWDVVGEITLTAEISRPGQRVVTTLGPYSGRKVERTPINPSRQMIKRVLTGALMDTVHQMSSDPQLISALSKRQKN